MIRGNQLPKKTHELRRIRRESFQLFEANIGERIFQQHRYRSIVDWAPNSAVLDRTTIWQQETRRKGKRRTYILCGWQQWETSRATSFLGSYRALCPFKTDLHAPRFLVFYSMLIHLAARFPSFYALSLNFSQDRSEMFIFITFLLYRLTHYMKFQFY